MVWKAEVVVVARGRSREAAAPALNRGAAAAAVVVRSLLVQVLWRRADLDRTRLTADMIAQGGFPMSRRRGLTRAPGTKNSEARVGIIERKKDGSSCSCCVQGRHNGDSSLLDIPEVNPPLHGRRSPPPPHVSVTEGQAAHCRAYCTACATISMLDSLYASSHVVELAADGGMYTPRVLYKRALHALFPKSRHLELLA